MARSFVSEDTRQAELALIDWFKQQGVHVITVDRNKFRTKVLPSHKNIKQSLGAELYDRLQNIK